MTETRGLPHRVIMCFRVHNPRRLFFQPLLKRMTVTPGFLSRRRAAVIAAWSWSILPLPLPASKPYTTSYIVGLYTSASFARTTSALE